MINVPSEIFDRSINDIEIGVSDIHLYSKEEIEEGQVGYRVDDKGNTIKEWIGDNYIVIGHDSCCGDPIITDISDKKLPVYSMFHDDWESLEKITDDFQQYLDILKKIDETDLGNEKDKDNLILEINKIVPNEAEDYWTSIIQNAYDFLNDIE